MMQLLMFFGLRSHLRTNFRLLLNVTSHNNNNNTSSSSSIRTITKQSSAAANPTRTTTTTTRHSRNSTATTITKTTARPTGSSSTASTTTTTPNRSSTASTTTTTIRKQSTFFSPTTANKSNSSSLALTHTLTLPHSTKALSNWTTRACCCFDVNKGPHHHTEQIKQFLKPSSSYNNILRTFTRYAASTIMPKTHNQFKLDDYDVIGFDLDGTLLRYNIGEMIPLEYQILTKFLVERRNYAPELLKKKFNMDFLQKGLVLDADHGNVLKLNKDAVIIRATHGTRFLSDEEIVGTYGEAREWQVATQFYKDPLSTWNGPLSEKIRSLLDYFDMSVSLVFAQVVDISDKENGGKPRGDYRQVWADILDGLLCMYTRENFSNGQSSYFNALKAEPSRYLLKTNPKVIQWLKQLRAAGKSTFLLTGSYVDFANFTATYALGPDWRQLFDVVICFARKPGFFVQQRPFLPTQNNAELSDSPLDLKAAVQLNGSTYTQGNWHQLLATFAKQLKTPANNISALYVGDNILQDIYSPVKHHDLNAVAICEEMFERSLEFPYQNVVKSEAWGSYFDVNEDCTMWAAIIKEYAEICVPTVDALLDQPLDGVFICDENKFYRTKTT